MNEIEIEVSSLSLPHHGVVSLLRHSPDQHSCLVNLKS